MYVLVGVFIIELTQFNQALQKPLSIVDWIE